MEPRRRFGGIGGGGIDSIAAVMRGLRGFGQLNQPFMSGLCGKEDRVGGGWIVGGIQSTVDSNGWPIGCFTDPDCTHWIDPTREGGISGSRMPR